MSRAQDLLDAAISSARASAESLDGTDASQRAAEAADRMEAMKDRFLFKSLAGVPLANRAKKAASAMESGGAGDVAALEKVVNEMIEKLDEPGAVLT